MSEDEVERMNTEIEEEEKENADDSGDSDPFA